MVIRRHKDSSEITNKILSEKEIPHWSQLCCSCSKFKSKNSKVHTLLIGGREIRVTEDEETDYLLKR